MARITRVFLVCLICEALNYICSYICCDMLHIPLFMDTIFTIAVTFYYGLVPGLCVGIGFNIISALTQVGRGYNFDPFSLLFGVCSAIVAIVTWYFARKKEEFKISRAITLLYLVLIAIISSFLVILTSGMIDFIRFTVLDIPDRIAPVKQFTDSFVDMHFSLLMASILAQVPVSITDRLLTTFMGYGVYKSMVYFLGEEEW
ncbi:MAG: hypothetical protein II821_05175 [Treponema sp.]|nr:hypothetical protein [Treponema sp.]